MAYLLQLAALMAILYIAALGLDLMFGEGGLLNLCQGGFMGLGAYAFAVVAGSGGSVFGGVVAAVLLVAPCGYLTAWLARNLTEVEFPVVTFGLQLILSSLFRNLDSITGGPVGLSGLPVIEAPAFLNIERAVWSTGSMIVVAGALTALSCAVRESAFGRLLRGIRDDELLLSTLGKNTPRIKSGVVAVGASFAGVAGALYATQFGYIQPRAFDFSVSILLLAIVVIGGPASTLGVALGVGVVIGAPELLRYLGTTDAQIAQIREVAFGALLILIIRFRPRGLVGNVEVR